MKVLVACEYSGTVRDAFINHGYEAMSCDLRETESTGPHYKGDVRDVLYDDWDLMIGHPDCTYLTIAGAASFNDPGRAEKREEAIKFFQLLQNAPIKHIALENPFMFKAALERVGKYDQYVNPFDFGVPERKRMALWLTNLPLLQPTDIVEVKPNKTYIRKSGPKAGQPYYTYYHQGKSAKERARFFPCIANAMADQWGSYVASQLKQAAAE